jgi:hypothetical protein
MDDNESLRTIAEELRNFARHAYGRPVVVPVTPGQLNRLADRLEKIADGLAQSPLTQEALADFICEVEDRLGPGCDELAVAQAILRKFNITWIPATPVTSTAQSPLPGPYAIDGCVLENQEVGPCLCANPDLCAVTSTERGGDT